MPDSFKGLQACLLLLTSLALGTAARAADTTEDPPWVEQAVGAPPEFSQAHLLTLETPNFQSVQVAIDPATLQLGGDGVLRYVMVLKARSGTVTASYQALRCATRETKTYALYTASGQWSAVSQPQWKPVAENGLTHLAWVFARQAACSAGLSPDVPQIIQLLKHGQPQNRFPYE